jgi:hypothetical protein
MAVDLAKNLQIMSHYAPLLFYCCSFVAYSGGKEIMGQKKSGRRVRNEDVKEIISC